MSKVSLYELNGKFLMLQELLEEEVIDEEVYKDTLESIDAEIEDKAEGYAIIMKGLENEVEALDKEIKRLQNRKTVTKNKYDKLKQNLFESMEVTGKTKFKTNLFSFNIRNNAPSVGLVDDGKSIKGEDYWVSQPDKLNKKAILQDLKDGKEVEGAFLKRTKTLTIK